MFENEFGFLKAQDVNAHVARGEKHVVQTGNIVTCKMI
jgi:hypothetical protein